jgi:hypothetical protein
MLAKVAIAICSTVTEANKERSMSDSARTGCSVPPNHGRLATGEKRLFGDLISYRNSGKGCTRALIGSNEP